MGTPSSKKFIKQVGGNLTEEAALLTSAGAGDANTIPALNAQGVLDASIVNSTTTSVGAGSSGKVVALDAAGKIDNSMLSFGPELATAIAAEAISAGNLVNIYTNVGVVTMRKADAAANRPANGFVLGAVASAASGTYYADGRITGLSGLTPGASLYLGAAGAATATAPTAAGSASQQIGFASSATEIMFNPKVAVLLA